MKHLFLLTFSILISLSASSQQYGWKDLSENIPIEGELTDVFFVSEDEGWITTAFADSTILHTTDGGAIFEIQKVPLSPDIYAIHMLDSLNGYCGGPSGWIYKTSNGGQIWNILSSMGTFTDISFPPNTNPDNPIGYACGDAGNVWEITNTLTNLNSPSSSTFRGISAPSVNKLWSCGGGRIYYYNGIDFISQSGPSGSFNDIYFINGNNGWVVGDGGTMGNTINGGDLWNPIVNPDPYSRTLIKVFFLTLNEGWAVGAEGVILHSTDGGISWVIEGEGLADLPLRSVHFTSPTNGYIVGNNNTLLKYTEVSGIGENEQQLAFEVYPNPCQDELTLRYSILDPRSSILQVIDQTGRMIYQEEFVSDGVMEFSLDVSHLPAGLYLVKMMTEDGVGVRKIIKQ